MLRTVFLITVLDYVGEYTGFVMMCATLLNEGKSAGAVLVEIMPRSEDAFDRFNFAITQACIRVILKKYLYIDFNSLFSGS